VCSAFIQNCSIWSNYEGSLLSICSIGVILRLLTVCRGILKLIEIVVFWFNLMFDQWLLVT